MLKRFVNILLSLTLFITLLINGVAHEYIHLFTGHEDTIDHVTGKEQKGTVSIDNIHHHCDFLQFHASAFLTSAIDSFFVAVLEHKDSFITNAVSFLSSDSFHTALRGPPALA